MNAERTYIYLDSVEERKNLIGLIQQIRNDVRQIVDTVPENEWYTERYHGWSLAAMLGHLNLIDNFALLQIKASLLNIRPSLSMPIVNRMNDFMARVYRQRVVGTSLKGMQQNEKRIAEFILSLPMTQFSKQVFYPIDQRYTTVERVIQDYFVYHWRGHLKTMQDTEQIRQSSN